MAERNKAAVKKKAPPSGVAPAVSSPVISAEPNFEESVQQWDTGLFDNYEKKILDLKNLVRISGLINTEMNMAEMTQSLLYSCQGMMLARMVTLFIMKSIVSNTYAYGASVGLSNENVTIEFDDNDPLIRTLTEKHTALYIREIVDHSELRHSLDRLASLEPDLVIPMLYKDKLSGFLVIGAKITGESFTSSEVDFMTSMANLAAIAIENLRLFEMATRDRMTNLYVHHYFQNRLEEEIARSLRYNNHRLALLMFDIDHFKNVNDTWGHQAGDIVIKEIAGMIRDKLRKLDLPARYGGEEFAVILPESDIENALMIGERIRNTVCDHVFDIGGGRTIKITISAGASDLSLAVVEGDACVEGATASRESLVREALIRQTDTALYASKHNGRNRSTAYKPGMVH